MTGYLPEETLSLLLTTAPGTGEAERIGRALVEEGLAACCTRIPGAVSLFRWRGELEEAEEVLLLLKTAPDRVEALSSRLRELHPYEVPELLVLPARSALPEYRAWVVSETR